MEASDTAFLAAFHQALSAEVFCIDGTVWRRTGSATVMSVPAALIQPVGSAQVDRVLHESGCRIAQFPTAAATGVTVARYVLRDKGYSEDSLQRQFRQMLRRSRNRLTCRPLSWEELAVQGPRVLDASRPRQGNPAPVHPDLWRDACALGSGNPRVGAFGCLEGDSLVGVTLLLRRHGGQTVLYTAVHPDSFPLGAANALLYEGLHWCIRQPDCDFVGYGHSGLPEMKTVGRFKRHAGLVEEPLHLALVLHPSWRWLRRIERCTRGFSSLRSMVGPGHHLSGRLGGIIAAAATDPRLLPE